MRRASDLECPDVFVTTQMPSIRVENGCEMRSPESLGIDQRLYRKSRRRDVVEVMSERAQRNVRRTSRRIGDSFARCDRGRW